MWIFWKDMYNCVSLFNVRHEYRQLFVLKQRLDWKLSFESQKTNQAITESLVLFSNPFSSLIVASSHENGLKAALINIYVWTMDQTTMCNVTGVTCRDEPTGNNHLTWQFSSVLRNIIASLRSSFWFYNLQLFSNVIKTKR